MTGRGSWLAPLLAFCAIALTLGIDLWRGSPAPLPAPGVPLPAVAEHAPLPGEAWRDPFQVKAPPVPPAPPAPPAPPPSPVRAASPAASPPPSAMPPPPALPPPVPPYPVFSGTLVSEGRPALVVEEGLVPAGKSIGPWKIVTVEFDRVVIETKQWRVTLDPEGKEIKAPERLK